MTVAPTNYNFDNYFNDLVNSSLDPTNMTAVASTAYTGVFGSVFWGILFAVIFLMMLMRIEDVTIPALVGLIIGGSLWALMPADWVAMAMSLTVISFAGLVYSLLKGRQ